MEEETIRALAIKSEYAHDVVDERKRIEVRTRPTRIRERVAIYATSPEKRILGTVEIYDSPTYMTRGLFTAMEPAHRAPEKYYKEGRTFFWYLKNPVKFAEPVKLDRWPSGGPWARIPKSILPELE